MNRYNFSINSFGNLGLHLFYICKYFLEYNSELDATVRSTKFLRSPLPQGDLEHSHQEILIKLRDGKGKASLEIFRKIKGFLLDNYLEPEKISLDVKAEEEEGDEFFVTF